MLNHKDHPSYSIEKAHDDQPDERLYECTYCKHGFTNAQALGGHMNVHRKEKAKNRVDSTNNKNSTARLYDSCLITSSMHDHKQERRTQEFMLRSSPMMCDHNSLSNYQNPNYGSISTGASQEEMRLSLSLSLHFGRSHEEESIQRGSEDGELDLELRLGQDR